MLCAEPRSASTNRKPYITLQRQIYDTFGEAQKILNKMTSHNFETTHFLQIINLLSTIPHSSKTIIFIVVFAFHLCRSSIALIHWLNCHDAFLSISYITLFAKSLEKHVFFEFSQKSTFVFFDVQKKTC